MPIPNFDTNGLLPNGVYDCSLEDISTHFTWNQHRVALYGNFLTFLQKELRPHFPDPVFFDGSFVTDKEVPEDTDVVLDLRNAPDARKWQGLVFMQQHQQRLKADYSVHFWINLPGNNDFSSFFQYIGAKTARLKGLQPKHQKGILRVL